MAWAWPNKASRVLAGNNRLAWLEDPRCMFSRNGVSEIVII
jgi:hypothetical protein